MSLALLTHRAACSIRPYCLGRGADASSPDTELARKLSESSPTQDSRSELLYKTRTRTGRRKADSGRDDRSYAGEVRDECPNTEILEQIDGEGPWWHRLDYCISGLTGLSAPCRPSCALRATHHDRPVAS